MSTYTELILKRNKIIKRGTKALAKGRGLYTSAQITAMINDEGYIPVASAAELDALRNSVSQTMGVGTIWENTYTTGLDKKYVQVRDVDFQSLLVLNNFSGVYDGNELQILSTGILFGINNAILKNIRVRNTITHDNAILCGVQSTQSGPSYITNCIGIGNIDLSHISGGLVIGSQSRTHGTYIEGCGFMGSIKSTKMYLGGIIGLMEKGEIKNSFVFANIIGSNTYVGGIVGYLFGDSIVEKCGYSGRITNSGLLTGGICCQNVSATIIKCISSGEIISINNFVGGITGDISTSPAYVENCFSSMKINGVGTSVGGLSGRNNGRVISNSYSIGKVNDGISGGGLCGTNTGTITNSYYDSQTSGQSDTGKGLPRTTAQLQNATADSFILPDGSVDPDSLAANAMFTSWDKSKWRFNPNNKYPRLK